MPHLEIWIVSKMEFALVNGTRTKPNKGQRGICQYCDNEMIAKCGRYVMWHWAHKAGSSCDPWWGSESEWHREWKGLFPENWREVVHFDERTGEKHIADVKTPNGLVIEFQNSPIDYDELASREAFYQNMIWIVNGNRGNFDRDYFNMGLLGEPLSFRPLVHVVQWWGTSRLFQKWDEAIAPVYFDFDTLGIWRFLEFFPDDIAGVFAHIMREWLVDACIRGEEIPFTAIPPDSEEKYLAQRQLVEVRANDYEAR